MKITKKQANMTKCVKGATQQPVTDVSVPNPNKALWQYDTGSWLHASDAAFSPVMTNYESKVSVANLDPLAFQAFFLGHA